MQKLIPFLTKYWYLPVFVVLLVIYLLKKKKVTPENKDTDADSTLLEKGIKDVVAQNAYKNIAAQIAHNLGTAYSVWNPQRWTENDEEVYNLVEPLSLNEFKVVGDLYFKTYAKGRNLSTDLAKLLDKKYYSLLKVK